MNKRMKLATAVFELDLQYKDLAEKIKAQETYIENGLPENISFLECGLEILHDRLKAVLEKRKNIKL
jgi:hypothetical protein|tara:strand:- start:493 stop:693 length:201 start_codon:yes stop_codon:yes gene_type:complete